MRRPTAAPIALLAVLTLAGCSSWHATNVPEPAPPSAAAHVHESKVRVQLADGRRVQIDHAYVDGDTLRGDVASEDRRAYGGRRAAIALADVRTLDGHGFDTGRTMALFLGIMLAAGWALRAFVSAAIGDD